jgi:hypothetical protein
MCAGRVECGREVAEVIDCRPSGWDFQGWNLEKNSILYGIPRGREILLSPCHR